MSYKKWILGIAIIFIVILVGYAIFNYFFDFYGYWVNNDKGTFLTDTYDRALKFKHISNNLDKYDGYIIGGSKAGALNPEIIKEYEEGDNFYNLSVPWGCFEDYKAFIQYIAENTSAKKIILHLSSIDVTQYSREKLPTVITKNKLDMLKEKLSFLIINPNQIRVDKNADKKSYFPNGMRNYSNVYEKMEKER